MVPPDRQVCPACGGAGGGPFGRANSGWDVESYECVRCEGWGYIREAIDKLAAQENDISPPAVARPGIAKATPERLAADKAAEEEKRRRRTAG